MEKKVQQLFTICYLRIFKCNFLIYAIKLQLQKQFRIKVSGAQRSNRYHLLLDRHVKMSFIFGKQYFTFPVSQKGQISFPFPPWQKGQLYFSRYFSCTIFNKKSTASSAGFGLKSVEVLVFLKNCYLRMILPKKFKTF